ncbi:MAG: CehA/McbA family metallohydrolase [Chitinivibrionales bacterium]|nr:CehA/McbA family metallohydrolase [Chitinivibrionales bacterium]
MPQKLLNRLPQTLSKRNFVSTVTFLVLGILSGSNAASPAHARKPLSVAHVVTASPVTTARAVFSSRGSQYSVYFGLLHSHSNASDGMGSPESAYDYAKNNAHLDFFSLTDHSSSLSLDEWNGIQETAENYNEDGVFATLWGFEWTSSNYGHVAVLNTADYCTPSQSSANTFPKLCTWLSSNDGIAFLNHPGRMDFGQEFSHFETEPCQQVAGIELWNKSSGFDVYFYSDGYFRDDNDKSYIDEANSRGWKLGAAGSDDNHSGSWGNSNEFRLAVLATALNRQKLLEALTARRFYSTLDKNLALSFTINGQEMGSTVAATASPATVTVLAVDGDGEDFSEIQILNQNHSVVASAAVKTAQVDFTEELSLSDGDYYYVILKQADGDEAVSSPMWVSGSAENQLPQCTLNTPQTGASFVSPAVVTLEAVASDVDGSIISVAFYADTTLLGIDATVPFSLVCTTLAIGRHTLSSVATDDKGGQTVSAKVEITIKPKPVPVTVQSRINASSNDVEENKRGAVATRSGYFELVYSYYASGDQTVGLRFTDMAIPPNAVIKNAYVQFTSDKIKEGVTKVTIYGQASDNAEYFSTARYNVSKRPRTESTVIWDIPAWNSVGAAGVDQRTPDIKSIVQEIVNRKGYTTASALAIIITGTGCRIAKSYERSASAAPLLCVEYTAAQ